MTAALISSNLLEQIAFRHGLLVEADGHFEYVTHRGQEYRAVLRAGGVR